MKIYKRAEFLEAPTGTIYAKGKQWYFGGLKVKRDTADSGNDWWSLDPSDIEHYDLDDYVDKAEEMLATGASCPMNNSLVRDGLHDANALFLVFEKDDLLKLRGMIDKAIGLAP